MLPIKTLRLSVKSTFPEEVHEMRWGMGRLPVGETSSDLLYLLLQSKVGTLQSEPKL